MSDSSSGLFSGEDRAVNFLIFVGFSWGFSSSSCSCCLMGVMFFFSLMLGSLVYPPLYGPRPRSFVSGSSSVVFNCSFVCMFVNFSIGCVSLILLWFG